MKSLSALVLAITFALAVSANGQTSGPVPSDSPGGQPASVEYQLGPGDLIGVSVMNVEALEKTVRVSVSGSITLPLVGKIRVGGLTGEQLEEHLTAVIQEKGLINNPEVSIFIKEFRSQPVFVLGSVRTPGQYVVSQPLRLVDVIAMAGGIDMERAADYLQFQRRGGAALHVPQLDKELQGSGVTRIDLRQLFEKGDAELNVAVQGGDVVFVPERVPQVFYVVGEVNHPGAFDLPRVEQLLLSQALAQAGGPMKTAKVGNGILVRYDEKGTRQELTVDFTDILKGKEPDLQVRANDVIFIPGSKFKTIGYGLLGTIPNTISGAVVYGARRR